MEDFDKKTKGGIEPSQVAKEIAQVEQQISQFKNNVQKAFSGILDSPIDWDKVLMTRQLEVLATKQLTNIQNEMLKIQQATEKVSGSTKDLDNKLISLATDYDKLQQAQKDLEQIRYNQLRIQTLENQKFYSQQNAKLRTQKDDIKRVVSIEQKETYRAPIDFQRNSGFRSAPQKEMSSKEVLSWFKSLGLDKSSFDKFERINTEYRETHGKRRSKIENVRLAESIANEKLAKEIVEKQNPKSFKYGDFDFRIGGVSTFGTGRGDYVPSFVESNGKVYPQTTVRLSSPILNNPNNIGNVGSLQYYGTSSLYTLDQKLSQLEKEGSPASLEYAKEIVSKLGEAVSKVYEEGVDQKGNQSELYRKLMGQISKEGTSSGLYGALRAKSSDRLDNFQIINGEYGNLNSESENEKFRRERKDLYKEEIKKYGTSLTHGSSGDLLSSLIKTIEDPITRQLSYIINKDVFNEQFFKGGNGFAGFDEIIKSGGGKELIDILQQSISDSFGVEKRNGYVRQKEQQLIGSVGRNEQGSMIRGGDFYNNKDLEIDAKTQAWDNLEQSYKNTTDSLNAVNSLYVELKKRAEKLLAEVPDNENVKKVIGLLNYRLKHSVGLDKASVDSEQTITTSANALSNFLTQGPSYLKSFESYAQKTGVTPKFAAAEAISQMEDATQEKLEQSVKASQEYLNFFSNLYNSIKESVSKLKISEQSKVGNKLSQINGGTQEDFYRNLSVYYDGQDSSERLNELKSLMDSYNSARKGHKKVPFSKKQYNSYLEEFNSINEFQQIINQGVSKLQSGVLNVGRSLDSKELDNILNVVESFIHDKNLFFDFIKRFYGETYEIGASSFNRYSEDKGIDLESLPREWYSGAGKGRGVQTPKQRFLENKKGLSILASLGVGPGEYEKGLQNVEERLSLKQKQFDDNSSLTSEMQDAQNVVTRYKEKLAVAENSINEIESTFKQFLTKTKSGSKIDWKAIRKDDTLSLLFSQQEITDFSKQYKKDQDFIKKGQPKEVIDAESYLQNVGENGNVLLQEISYLTQIKTLLQDTIAIESRNRARIEQSKIASLQQAQQAQLPQETPKAAKTQGVDSASQSAEQSAKNAEKALKGEREAVEENNKALQQHAKDMGEAAQSEKEKVNISNELSKVLEKEKANLNNTEKANDSLIEKELTLSDTIKQTGKDIDKYSYNYRKVKLNTKDGGHTYLDEAGNKLDYIYSASGIGSALYESGMSEAALAQTKFFTDAARKGKNVQTNFDVNRIINGSYNRNDQSQFAFQLAASSIRGNLIHDANDTVIKYAKENNLSFDDLIGGNLGGFNFYENNKIFDQLATLFNGSAELAKQYVEAMGDPLENLKQSLTILKELSNNDLANIFTEESIGADIKKNGQRNFTLVGTLDNIIKDEAAKTFKSVDLKNKATKGQLSSKDILEGFVQQNLLRMAVNDDDWLKQHGVAEKDFGAYRKSVEDNYTQFLKVDKYAATLTAAGIGGGSAQEDLKNIIALINYIQQISKGVSSRLPGGSLPEWSNLVQMFQTEQQAQNEQDAQQGGKAFNNKLISKYAKNKKEQYKVIEDMQRLELTTKQQGESQGSQVLMNTYRQRLAFLEEQLRLIDITKLSEEEQVRLNEKLNDLNQAHITNSRKIAASQKQQVGFLQKLVGGFKQQITYLIDMSLAYQAVGKLRQIISSVIQKTEELDSRMVDLQIATGMNRDEIKVLMKDYVSLGRELGRTTTDVAAAANDWLRAGYEGKEAAELTKGSMMLSTLGMIESAEATKYLISTLKGWKLNAEDVIGVVDKLTAVDMSAAISAGDLALAMSRANNSAKLAGADMNNFIGYVTTVADVSQKSAESVGESFKTIFSRFGNVKAGKFVATMEEKNASGYNDQEFENLNDIEKVLGTVGIKLRTSTTNWRNIDSVMEEIGQKWGGWDQTTQNAVATAVAGTRQRENVLTLFANWDQVSKYADIATNAYGTSVSKMEAYTDSVEASKNRLTNAVEKWSLSLDQSETIKFFYNSLSTLAENIHLVISAITMFLAITRGGQFASKLAIGAASIGNKLMSTSNYFEQATTKREGLGSSFVTSFKEGIQERFLAQQQRAYGLSLQKLTSQLNEEQVLKAQQLQAILLGLEADKKKEISSALLEFAKTKQIDVAFKSVTTETLLTLAEKMLSAETYKQIEQLYREHKDVEAEARLREEMNNAIANYIGKLNKATVTLMGNNLGTSSELTPQKMMAQGAISMGAMAIGGLGGSGLAQAFGAGEGGQMFGSMVGGMAAPMLAKTLMGATAVTGPVVGAAVALGTLVVGAVVKGIKASREKALKNLQEEFKSDVEVYNNMKTQLINAEKFDKLKSGVDTMGRNVSLSDDDYSKYLELSNQLAEVFPSLVIRTDEAGNKIVGFGDALGDVVPAIKEMTEAAQKQADAAFVREENGQSAFGANIDTAADKIKEVEKNRKDSQKNIDEFINSISRSYDPINNTIFAEEDILDTNQKGYYNGLIQSMLKDEKWKDYWDEIKNNQYAEGSEALEYIKEKMKEYPERDDSFDREIDEINASMLDDYKTYIRNLAASGSTAASKLLNTMTDEGSALYENVLKQIDVSGDVEGQLEDAIDLLNNTFEKLNEITLSFGGQEYSGVQIVSMSFDSFDFVGDAQKARKEVAKVIEEIFGPDGYDENEKKIILSLGFEISDDGILVDTQDIIPKLAEALGLGGDSFLTNFTKWGNIGDWTPEQLKRVYELVNKGIINKDTSATGVYNVLQSEPQNAKESQIRRDYLSENYQDTGTDITQYLLDVKNGLIDVDDNEILEKWGHLGSGMVQTISESAKEISGIVKEEGATSEEAVKTTGEKIKSTLEQYDSAILGSFKDTAQKYAQEVFSGIETGTNGYIDTASEMVNVINAITDSFEKLAKAQQEQADEGTVSWKTYYELLSESLDYADLFESDGNGNLKLVTDARKKMYEIQRDALKAQIEASIQEKTIQIQKTKAIIQQIDATGQYKEESINTSLSVIESMNVEGEAVAKLANEYLALGDAAAYANSAKQGNADPTLKAAAQGKHDSITYTPVVTTDIEARQTLTGKEAQMRREQAQKDLERLETEVENEKEKLKDLPEEFDDLDWTRDWDRDANLSGGSGSGTDKYLDRLKSKLAGVNKEWYQMAKFKNWPLKVGQEGNYYTAIRNTLGDIIKRLEAKLALELASNGVTEEYYSLLQQLQEFEVQRENLDDEEAEDRISILESQGLLNSRLIQAYEVLVSTADTEAEYYEYQKRLNDEIKEYKELLYTTLQYWKDLLDIRLEYESYTPYTDKYNSLITQTEANLRQQMLNAADRAATAYTNLYNAARREGYSKEESLEQAERNADYQGAVKQYAEAFKALGNMIIKAFEDKVQELQQKIDDMGDSRAKEWTSIEQIESYYGNLDKLYNYILDRAQVTLQNVDTLTDEEIQKIVDGANDAIKNINDNMIDLYKDIKSYQEDIYSALTNEIGRYKKQLEQEKEIVEDRYNKEINKLTDKQKSIERTNKLLQIQQQIQQAGQEKERVWREGIGWSYETDRTKQKELQKQLKDFQLQDQIDDLSNAKDAELNTLNERIANWDEYLEALETRYKEYDMLQEQKLLKELLGVETQEAVEAMIKGDMNSFVDYIDKNQAGLLENMTDVYMNFGTTFGGFLDGYKNNLETLDYYNKRTLDLLKASDFNATNGSELLEYLDSSKLKEEEKKKFRQSSVKIEPIWEDVDYNGTLSGDIYNRALYNVNASGKDILDIQQHISQKYGQGSIKKDGLLGDQTLSAVIQAARLGDSEAIQFAQKYGIDYSKGSSSFGISGGTSNGNRPSGGSNGGGGGSTNPGSSVSKDVGDVFKGNNSSKNNWDKTTAGGIINNIAGSGSMSQQVKNKKDKNKNTNKTSTKTQYSQQSSGSNKNGYSGYWRSYSSGIENGPITYTGLAMLHGTPTTPEYVLNSDQAYSLLRYMATNSPKFTPINSSGNVTYSYGDIIMNGVNDPEEFFSELTSAMDRKYSTTKNRK